MSGSQKRLKRNGSMASSESGPPSWKRTTPVRRDECAIPLKSLTTIRILRTKEQRMLLNHEELVNAEVFKLAGYFDFGRMLRTINRYRIPEPKAPKPSTITGAMSLGFMK